MVGAKFISFIGLASLLLNVNVSIHWTGKQPPSDDLEQNFPRSL